MPWNPEIDEYKDNRGSVIIEKQTLKFDTFDLKSPKKLLIV